MGKSHVRADKTCLNCNYVVENRFCGNCGQENIDTRKTFHHLFVHFFEDLTHYENSFWKTIRNLLFKPASLSKEYLSGKRMSYLAPVRLYIFISFVTFFLIAVIPSDADEGLIEIEAAKKDNTKTEKAISAKEKKLNEILESDLLSKSEKDSIRKIVLLNNVTKNNFNFLGFDSVEQLDSVQKHGKEDNKLPSFLYEPAKKSILISQKYTSEEIKEKLSESIMHNFPKVLILYMPLFALFLWVFHSKKRWYYFDHGIFTLHYFSFLLLISLIFFLTDKLLGLFGDNAVVDTISIIINLGGYGWMIYYLFPAHHRFYGETRLISFIKTFLLFFINLFFMALLFLAFFVYSFINIH